MLESLVIGWFLSFGYVPEQQDYVHASSAIIYPNDMATVVEIGLSAELSPFRLYGSIENFQTFSGKAFFYPYRADYKIGAELKISETVSIIAEHECDHPVITDIHGQMKYNYVSDITKIVIKIQGGGSCK